MRTVQRRIGLCIAALTSLMCAVSSSLMSHPPAMAGEDYVKFKGEVQKIEELANCVHHTVRVTDVVQAPSGYPLKVDKEVYVVWCQDWAGRIDKVNVGDFVEVLGPVDWSLVYDLGEQHHYMKKVPRDIKFRGTVTLTATGSDREWGIKVEEILQDPIGHLSPDDLAWISTVNPSCIKSTIKLGDYVEVYAKATQRWPQRPHGSLEKDYHYIMKVAKTKPTSEDVVFRGTVTQTTEGYKVRVEQIMQDSTGHLILGELAWLTPVLPSCVKGTITVGDYVEVCGEAKPKLPGQLQVVELEKDYHYIMKVEKTKPTSEDVKFRGTLGPGEYSVTVKEVLNDPTGALKPGITVWVKVLNTSCVKGTVKEGDYVEVYARRDPVRWPGHCSLEKDYHYLKKVDHDGSDNSGNGKENGHVPPWRKDIKPGDILLHRAEGILACLFEWTHAGIYVGDGLVVEARPEPWDLKGCKDKDKCKGINTYPITDWDEENDPWVLLLRVYASEEQRKAAAQWALNQTKRNPKPGYSLKIAYKDPSPDSPSWYCSELVWAAYYNLEPKIDLGYLSWGQTPPKYYFYIPIPPGHGLKWEHGRLCWCISEDDSVYELARHTSGERPKCKFGLLVKAKSPVDLALTDPDGLTTSKEKEEILEAAYVEFDFEGDESPEDIIIMPERKEGDYLITVLPEPGASPTDTYSLEVSTMEQTIILAKDVHISDIPKLPYVVKSSKSGIEVGRIITPKGLALLSPNGGEVLEGRRPFTIQWAAPPDIVRVDLFVSVDGGKRWREIARRQPNTGSFKWTTPNMDLNKCLIRIDGYDAAKRRLTDTSDAPFSVRRRPGAWFSCR